jgi:hypothetical protein
MFLDSRREDKSFWTEAKNCPTLCCLLLNFGAVFLGGLEYFAPQKNFYIAREKLHCGMCPPIQN